jgi:ABC-2 type transport system permease protein
MNSFIIAGNMIRRLVGTKKGFFMIAIIPVVTLSVMISIFSTFSYSTVNIAVLNEDTGFMGNHMIQEIQTHDDYKLTVYMDAEAAKEAVIAGQVEMSMLIPSSFTASMLQGTENSITLYHLNQNANTFAFKIKTENTVRQLQHTVNTAKSSGEITELNHAEKVIAPILDQISKRQVNAKITDQLSGSTGLNTIIGFMLMFMMGLIGSTVVDMMEDQSRMTLARVYAAPVRSYEIALGKFLGSYGIGALQIILTLVFVLGIMRYDLGVGFIPLFLILNLYLVASMGIAVVLASFIKNITNLGAMNTLITIPTSMIGGCFWPIQIMPDFMQKIANFVPQKWAIEAIEILASGASYNAIIFHVLILLLFAVILISIGSAVLRPSEPVLK